MENEYFEENATDVVEDEAVYEENVANDSDGVLSDTGIDGDANVEGAASDPVTEQSAETGSDAPPDTVETGEDSERTFTQEELEQIVTAVLTDEADAEELEVQTGETTEVDEVSRTLFNTSLEEYTVSEGLLVCIFLLLLANLINSIFKGSHWFGKL